ncbi:MAG TPA: amidohydrolase family protein [Pseudolabrys sp.]|jgi:2,3-dihydroxybenzoate decarboxylase|nr:amidohydrolase family protein [Pseudolabrys sp.]
MVQKIALEEHFLSPGLVDYWKPTVTEVPPAFAEHLFKRLTDFSGARLETMDKAGIAKAVLAVSGPGVQAERDPATATKKAREANDFLAQEIHKRPDRYAGFAHIAVQDARGAADELERCMRDLKFCGAMINGHTNGLYLDDRSLDPFWERAEALGAVVYIHPTDPLTPAPVLNGVPALRRATWEWGFETGSHALRLVFSGLFDRFPKARVALGHMGETLPYLLWRFDSRAKLYGVELAKPPSQYIKENIWVTVSGVFAAEPLRCAVDALGRDRVMFAADYPFENAEEAGHFMDSVAIEEPLRADVAYNNAAKLLRLS